MKTKFFLLSLVFAAFLSSSMPFGSHSLEIGKEAPLLTLSSDSKASPVKAFNGKYVVLNFWNPSDPESRINNKRLAEFTSALPSSQIQFVSICTASDPLLQSEIMEADGIPSSALSLSLNDLSPEVLNDYQTSSGCRSFLIDPFGNLKDISPSLSDIKKAII